MFYSCDIVTKEELMEALNTYIGWIRGFTDSRVFIFLDEISSVEGWQKAVKVLFDKGLLENATMILTGSHSIDIKRSMELLPGRKGEISRPDKEFLPLDFAAYVGIHDKTLTNKKTAELMPLIGRLNRLLERYLITGGFPRVIDFYNKNRALEEFLFEDYINWILGDFKKIGKSEYYLKAILRGIVETLASRVGWETIKKRIDIGSVNTVQEYVDDLRHSFLVEYIFNIDISKRVPMLQKQKKIYIRDPFIFHAVRRFVYNTPVKELTKLDEEEKSKIIESVVCDHLARHFETFYWAGKKGKEIDFAVKRENRITGIEVKYGKGAGRHGFGGFSKFKKVIILTKNEFDIKAKHPRVPVAVFLLNPGKFI